MLDHRKLKCNFNRPINSWKLRMFFYYSTYMDSKIFNPTKKIGRVEPGTKKITCSGPPLVFTTGNITFLIKNLQNEQKIQCSIRCLTISFSSRLFLFLFALLTWLYFIFLSSYSFILCIIMFNGDFVFHVIYDYGLQTFIS